MSHGKTHAPASRYYRQLPALGAALGLLLSSCDTAPKIDLPADPQERAALCYGAAISQFASEDKSSTLTMDQAGQAAHFLLLGGSDNGVGEPTKIEKITARGQALQSKFDADKNAADYAAPCAAAYPETNPSAFKGLPADGSDTRLMCYTLSTAVLQMFGASKVTPDKRAALFVKLNSQLDQSTLAEWQAAGDINPAELAGRAMRALAQAVRLGPPLQVMQACADRYVKS